MLRGTWIAGFTTNGNGNKLPGQDRPPVLPTSTFRPQSSRCWWRSSSSGRLPLPSHLSSSSFRGTRQRNPIPGWFPAALLARWISSRRCRHLSRVNKDNPAVTRWVNKKSLVSEVHCGSLGSPTVWPSARHQPKLQNRGHVSSVSHGVPVY